MITAMIMKAMLGISLLMNIEKLFKGGTAPPSFSGSADFSVAANSMYVPLLLGGLG